LADWLGVDRGRACMSGSAGASVEFRPASESDLAGEYALVVAAQQELHKRRGVDWPTRTLDPSGMWAQVHRHLMEHDGERSFVAEETDESSA
jgi:hypothetical protein